MAEKQDCRIAGCGRPIKARGWCEAHYKRWRLHGDPLVGGKVTHRGEPAEYLDTVLAEGPLSRQCLVWPYARNAKGYGHIKIDGETREVHRVVCERVNGPPPTPDHEARHLCGNGHLGCINPGHVTWGTRLENKADELQHGTRNRGRRNGQAKLTEADVLNIRAADGVMPRHQIGAQYGVTAATVNEIVWGQTWAWLEGVAP